ncbi:MAG: hypothetical protein AB2693_06230, partial [Candidatus Thiodiazotropha sp.]
ERHHLCHIDTFLLTSISAKDSKLCMSRESIKYTLRVKVNAAALKNIVKRNFMPDLVSVSFILFEKWT